MSEKKRKQLRKHVRNLLRFLEISLNSGNLQSSVLIAAALHTLGVRHGLLEVCARQLQDHLNQEASKCSGHSTTSA